MKYPFPYSERAAAVRAALETVSEATCGLAHKNRDDKTKAGVEQARQNYRAAVASAYHPDFWTVFKKLKSNEVADADVVVDFLEADPIFFGSGYIKAHLTRLLQHVKLSTDQTTRLKDVLLMS